jgi:predicted acyl esterase
MAIVRLVNSAGTPLPRMVAALKGNWIGVDSKGSEVTEEAVSKAVFTKAVWEGEFSQPRNPVEYKYLELEADFSDNSFYQDTKLRVKIKRKCTEVKNPKGGIEEKCVYSAPSDITIFATNITRTEKQAGERREAINTALVSQAKKKVKG